MTSSVTLDHLTSEEQLEKNRHDEARARFNQALSIISIIMLVCLWLWANYKIGQYPSVSTVTIENMQVIGESALCPGDLLTVAFDFHAEGAGVLVRDNTARLITPPRTIVYSDWSRYILDGPTDEHMIEAWRVPATYLNHETDEYEPIPVGDYKRSLAISSPSKSTVVAIGSVQFSIKEDCGG